MIIKVFFHYYYFKYDHTPPHHCILKMDWFYFYATKTTDFYLFIDLSLKVTDLNKCLWIPKNIKKCVQDIHSNIFLKIINAKHFVMQHFFFSFSCMYLWLNLKTNYKNNNTFKMTVSEINFKNIFHKTSTFNLKY